MLVVDKVSNCRHPYNSVQFVNTISLGRQFLPRDAKLARYMLSSRVRLSVCHKPVLYWNETTWFLAWRLPFIYPALCYEEMWVSPKIKVLPSGTCNSQTPDLENQSTKLVIDVVDGGACWRHLYDNRRVVAVYYKSINCNPLTPVLRFVVDLSYNLFLQLTRFRLT